MYFRACATFLKFGQGQRDAGFRLTQEGRGEIEILSDRLSDGEFLLRTPGGNLFDH